MGRTNVEIAGHALNGREAVCILEQSSVDIVITDIRMPEMDGLELLRYCKSLPRGIHCIILSVYEEFAYLKKAMSIGIEDYILKPIDAEELRGAIRSIIEKTSAAPRRQRNGWSTEALRTCDTARLYSRSSKK